MASKTGNGTRKPRKAASVQTPVSVPVIETNGNAVLVGLEDQIRRRAYEIYLERGASPGNENEDWILAEREVRSRQPQHSAHP